MSDERAPRHISDRLESSAPPSDAAAAAYPYPDEDRQEREEDQEQRRQELGVHGNRLSQVSADAMPPITSSRTPAPANNEVTSIGSGLTTARVDGVGSR
jgi:hypothetical protein